MKIRTYEPGDWQRLKAIHDEARKIELYSAGLDKAYLTLEETYKNEGLFEYDLLVAENNKGLVLGFIAFSTDEIGWIYVDPLYHRQGVASTLIDAAMDRTGDEVTIEVLENNTGALDLYEKWGFTKTKKVKGTMPGNEEFTVTVDVLRYLKNK